METKDTNIQIKVMKQHNCVTLFSCLFVCLFVFNINYNNSRLVVSNFVSWVELVIIQTELITCIYLHEPYEKIIARK